MFDSVVYLSVVRNYKMTVRLSIIIFFLTPFVLMGQTNSDSLNESLGNDIYLIIKTVIKTEKINRNLGLALIPDKNCNLNQDDTAYLKTLLLKPKSVDTVKRTSSSEFIVVSNLTYPDKNILTFADINYILKTKEGLAGFKWDNKKLSFNLKNEKKYYSFSVPYFNSTHDNAIVMYRYLCPGLCGGGSTILLTKTDKGWDNTTLELWFH